MKNFIANKYAKIALTVAVFALIFLFFNYFILVPINLRFGGVYVLVGILLIIIGLTGLSTQSKIKYNVYTEKNMIQLSLFEKVTLASGGGVIVLYILFAIFSSSMFHADDYHALVGEIPDAIEFASDFDAVDTDSNLPIIDSSLAEQLGDKEFGKYGSLGSEFHVGEFHDLSVDGNLVSVAPLEYNDFFKWMNNKNGAPGYVIVDKTTGDVEVVTELDMKYMPSAYFGTDLHRHIYQNGEGAKQYKLIDFALELDDESNPYWVVNAIEPTIGITGGLDVQGVYIVDPNSGEIDYYNAEDAPNWVDTVYPKELVIDQLNYWGSLGDGWLNSVFAEKNVLQTTDGSRRVYNDNEVYHYTGLTSASSDEATVGFVFVNTKTKEVVRYNMSGATETAAMESAEGIVQNFGYTATFPIPMNVYNEPTFLITLKDNKGLIKQYAFVNVSDFAIVGLGDTLDKAYSDYGEKIDVENTGNYNETDIITIRGTVQRISMSVVDGSSQYDIIIDDVLYTARYKTSSYLSITEVNDEVVLELIGTTVVGFTNIDLEGEVD